MLSAVVNVRTHTIASFHWHKYVFIFGFVNLLYFLYIYSGTVASWLPLPLLYFHLSFTSFVDAKQCSSLFMICLALFRFHEYTENQIHFPHTVDCLLVLRCFCCCCHHRWILARSLARSLALLAFIEIYRYCAFQMKCVFRFQKTRAELVRQPVNFSLPTQFLRDHHHHHHSPPDLACLFHCQLGFDLVSLDFVVPCCVNHKCFPASVFRAQWSVFDNHKTALSVP